MSSLVSGLGTPKALLLASAALLESYRLREEAKCDIETIKRDAETINQLTEELAS